MTKEDIIQQIKLLAKQSGGTSLSVHSFTQKTGIKPHTWKGKYWAKWGDAIAEAGLTLNQFFTPAYDETWVFMQIADYTRELGHFPTEAEFKLKRNKDKEFPSADTLRIRFGRKAELTSKIAATLKDNADYQDVYQIIQNEQSKSPTDTIPNDNNITIKTLGYVYLVKEGRNYKIGKTMNLHRRISELQLQSPEKRELIHSIETDDPEGIEAYWHNRFKEKWINKECAAGKEWFSLDAYDVASFKRRKFQ